MGYSVKKEVTQPIVYKDIKLDHGYRIDLLVEDLIVVELKTVENFDLFEIKPLPYRLITKLSHETVKKTE